MTTLLSPTPVAFVAVSKGKRAVIALADMAVAIVISSVAQLGQFGPQLFHLPGKIAKVLLWVGSGLSFVFAIFTLVAVCAKASRLLGWFSGVQHVDAVTGTKRGGKTFLKYLLVGMTAALTAGLAPLIIDLVTYKSNEGQTWFDKVCGLRVVDIKQTEGARIKADQERMRASVSGTGLPTIVPVEVVGFGAGVGAPPPYPAPQMSALMPVPPMPAQQMPIQQPPLVSQPMLPPPSAPLSAPVEAVPANPGFTPPVAQAWPEASNGGFIARVPFGPGAGARPPSAPEPPAKEILVRDARPVVPEDPEDVASQTLLSISELTGVCAPDMRIHLILDGNLPIVLEGAVILGRNPIVVETFPDARLLIVDDPERGISKTHLAVGPDVSGWWVMDLHSTNGVRIRHADGTVERLAPDHRHPVRRGSIVTFGRHSLTMAS